MIGMEMSQDDIRQLVRVHAGAFQFRQRIAGAIDQDGPLTLLNQ